VSAGNRIDEPRHRLARAEIDPFAQWVLQIAERRDHASFVCIFEHFGGRVKGYCLQRGVSEAHAEELAQDTMAAVWRKAAQFDPRRASVSTWIFTIARNLIVDKVRHDQIAQYLYDGVETTDFGNPEQELREMEAGRAVRAAVNSLPAEQARVLKLSFFEHRTHAEIACALKAPLGTVKSRIRQAVARLRVTLRAHH
jgi:RNA polymerase sigma-70 factor (ECF subfamily)